jgi:hypothetical protein
MSIIGNVFSQDNANIFQQNAIRYSSSYFHEDDEFIILGSMEINERKIVFANNVHIWGEAERATWRFLLFLDDGTFLGMYTGIVFDPTEIKIEEQRIIFPFNPEWGNSIEFSEGIPDRVWLDGAVILFLKIMKAYENL